MQYDYVPGDEPEDFDLENETDTDDEARLDSEMDYVSLLEDESRSSEQYSARLQEMLKSEVEDERSAAEKIKLMLDSTDAKVKADGRALMKMIATKPELAQAIANWLQGPEERHRFLEVIKDKKNANAAAVLEKMMTAPVLENSGSMAVGTLMRMFDGSAQEKADADKLLKMLNDPKEKDNARVLLEAFALNPQPLQGILRLMETPGKKDAVASMLSLLKSENVQEYRAATAIAAMLSSSDAKQQEQGAELLGLMKGEKKSDLCAVVAELADKPAQMATMLDLMSKPEFKTAATELLRMLKSEQGADSASRLLELMSSKFARDKADGKVLFDLLNSNKAEDRDAAGKLLGTSILDVESLHELVKLLGRPESRNGVMELLNVISSSSRKEKEAGFRLLDTLTGTAGERTTAAEIITLLGGDAEKKAAGKTILNKLSDAAQQRQLLDIMASKDHAAAATVLLQWLRGDGKEAGAARALLALRGTPEGGKNPFGVKGQVEGFAQIGLREADAKAEPNAVAEQLLKLLAGGKAQADTARDILNTLENPSDMRKMMEIAGNKEHAKAAERLFSMLQSNDYSEQQAARRLLASFDTVPRFQPTDRPDGLLISGTPRFEVRLREADGEMLLKMLGDDKLADGAKQILKLEDVQAKKLLDMFNSKDYKATAEKLMVMMKENGRYLDALKLLDLGAPEIKKMFEIMDSPDKQNAAMRLRSMQDVQAAGRLLRMLVSTDDAEKKLGEELLSALNEQRYNHSVEELLSTRLPSPEMATLRALQKDPKTERAASELINLTQLDDPLRQNGVQAVLLMLKSENEKTRSHGKQLLEMLSDKDADKRELASKLLSMVGDVRSIDRVMMLLNDPKRKPGAEQLVKMLGANQGTDDFIRRDPARDVILLLSTPNEEQRAAAEKLTQMLGDEKERAVARSIMNSLTPNQYAEMIKLVSPGEKATAAQKAVAEQLRSMIGRGGERGLATLMNLLGTNREAGNNLIEMLSDGEQRDNARVMLEKLNAGQCSALFNLLGNPKSESGGKVLLSALSSAETAKREGAITLLSRLARPVNQFAFDQGRGGGVDADSARLWVDLLSSKDTRALAERALVLAQTEVEAETIGRLLATESGRKHVERLLQMAAKPEEQSKVGAIMRASTPEQIDLLFKLIDDPKQKQATEQLLSMLADTEGTGTIAAFRLLSLLGAEGDEKKLGERFMSLLNSDESEVHARVTKILTGLPANAGALLDVFSNPALQVAAESITEMLTPEEGLFFSRGTLSVGNLINLLNDTTSDEGARLLAMLNDPRHKYTAMRLLEQMRTRRALGLINK